MELNNLQYGQNNEILRFIISNGIINLGDVQKSMEAMNGIHIYRTMGKEGCLKRENPKRT